MDQDKTTNIRKLNDMLRGQRIGGRILIIPGVQGLGLDSINLLLEEVANYDGFGSQNDPWDEHDGAAIVFQGQRYYWKIDYYDQTLKYGSPDPSDPLVTERVLTLMRSDEY